MLLLLSLLNPVSQLEGATGGSLSILDGILQISSALEHWGLDLKLFFCSGTITPEQGKAGEYVLSISRIWLPVIC